MVNTARKRICVPVGTVDKHTPGYTSSKNYIYREREYITVETNINSLSVRLLEFINKYSKDYTDLKIEAENDCGCRYDCSCPPSYYLYGTREEVDLEYNWRIAEETKREAEQKARDEREFEALKKKLGK